MERSLTEIMVYTTSHDFAPALPTCATIPQLYHTLTFLDKERLFQALFAVLKECRIQTSYIFNDLRALRSKRG